MRKREMVQAEEKAAARRDEKKRGVESSSKGVSGEMKNKAGPSQTTAGTGLAHR